MHRLFAQAVRTGCLAECHFKSCGLAGAAMTRARRVITSELGQTRRLPLRSVLPPTTDMCGLSEHVRFVLKPNLCTAAREVRSPFDLLIGVREHAGMI